MFPLSDVMAADSCGLLLSLLKERGKKGEVWWWVGLTVPVPVPVAVAATSPVD